MSATAPAIQRTETLDLAGLRGMNFEQLEALYRAGKRPSSLSDLDGDAQGAMLGWRFPSSGPLAWLSRTFGASSVFPWKGKSFKSESNDRGEGINRINFLGRGVGFVSRHVSMLRSSTAGPLSFWTIQAPAIHHSSDRS